MDEEREDDIMKAERDRNEQRKNRRILVTREGRVGVLTQAFLVRRVAVAPLSKSGRKGGRLRPAPSAGSRPTVSMAIKEGTTTLTEVIRRVIDSPLDLGFLGIQNTRIRGANGGLIIGHRCGRNRC